MSTLTDTAYINASAYIFTVIGSLRRKNNGNVIIMEKKKKKYVRLEIIVGRSECVRCILTNTYLLLHSKAKKAYTRFGHWDWWYVYASACISRFFFLNLLNFFLFHFSLPSSPSFPHSNRTQIDVCFTSFGLRKGGYSSSMHVTTTTS